MVILKHNNIIVGILTIIFLSDAVACESLSAAILIDGWIGEPPKKVELSIYNDDSKFTDKKKFTIEKNNIKLYREQEYPGTATLRIDFSELKSTGLPINADFLLVIDNKTEYRFSEIKPPKIRLGCRLEGKVNACSFESGAPVMSAEFKCGKPILKQ